MQPIQDRGRRGFTLVELLVVVAIFSILAAILFPVFSVAREKARQISCLSNQRQLGQALLIYTQDHDDTLPVFGDQWPWPHAYWTHAIQPYLRDERILHCPSWPKGGKYRNSQGRLVSGPYGIGVSYGVLFSYRYTDGNFNRDPVRLIDVSDPSRTMMMTDSQGSLHVYSPLYRRLTVDWDRDGILDSYAGILRQEGPYNRGDPFRHNGGANGVFLDGHARWIDARSWLTNRGDIWGSTLK